MKSRGAAKRHGRCPEDRKSYGGYINCAYSQVARRTPVWHVCGIVCVCYSKFKKRNSNQVDGKFAVLGGALAVQFVCLTVRKKDSAPHGKVVPARSSETRGNREAARSSWKRMAIPLLTSCVSLPLAYPPSLPNGTLVSTPTPLEGIARTH